MAKQPRITEADLFKAMRERRDLRAQADYFNENLPKGHKARRTFMSVKNWEDGEWKIDDDVLRAWMVFYQEGDPRFELAKFISDHRMESMRQAVRA